MKIGYVVDSTLNIKEEKGTKVVPLKVIIDGKEFVDGTFDYNLVIEGLKEERDIKTSQPSPEQFMSAINELLDEGYEKVMVLTLSKTLSGTYNNAILAREMLDNNNVYVYDTFSTIQGGRWIYEQIRDYNLKHKNFSGSIELLTEIVARGFFTIYSKWFSNASEKW